jgi:hypothetical protein
MYLLRSHKAVPSGRSLAWLAVGIALGAVAGSAGLLLAGEETRVETKSGRTIIRVEVETEPCGRCEVQGHFVQQLKKFGANAEFVELKKGVGIFYTTAKSKYVHDLQEVIEEAVEELEEINEHPKNAHLCQFCMADFPIYSKLDHELLQTSRGAMLIITSDDPEAIRAVKKMFRVYKSKGYREQHYGEHEHSDQAHKDR